VVWIRKFCQFVGSEHGSEFNPE